ncbi:MAG: nitroreductase/quinone reductase family protein [Acidimicrobiia bacterium]
MTLDRDAMAVEKTIDLTTTGRRSGMPRRIEIWWFRVDGRFIISGTPGRRDWLANIHADPSVVVHVDGADIPARAVPVDDVEFRRRFFTRPSTSWYSTQAELDWLVRSAPMVEIVFES